MTITPGRAAYRLPGMDCPTEEHLVRARLAGLECVHGIHVSLPDRTVVVAHDGPDETVDAALRRLGMGAARLTDDAEARALDAAPASPQPPDAAQARRERHALLTALGLNLVGFVVGIGGGLLVGSTAVLADGADMGADVAVYVLALLAVGAGVERQRRAALTMGTLMAVLAVGGFAEVVRRVVVDAPPPLAGGMAGLAVVGLLLNVGAALAVRRVSADGGRHVRSMWVMTSTDVEANLVVIGAAALVAWTGLAVPDLVVGTIVFAIVGRGALRVLADRA